MNDGTGCSENGNSVLRGKKYLWYQEKDEPKGAEERAGSEQKILHKILLWHLLLKKEIS